MIPEAYFPNAPNDLGPTNSTGTAASTLVFMLGSIGLLWAASNPILAVVILTAVALATVVFRRALALLARAMHGHITRLDVPGFGIVELRVTPR